MPTPTYDLIEEKILGSAEPSVTFNSIPGTYKDLVLEFAGTGSGQAGCNAQFNGDTGSNYSNTNLRGYGTNPPPSGRQTSGTALDLNAQVDTNQLTWTIHLMSYSNTNVHKTILLRGSNANSMVSAVAGLWRSTSAITSIYLYPTGQTFSTGCTFRLWGVAG